MALCSKGCIKRYCVVSHRYQLHDCTCTRTDASDVVDLTSLAKRAMRKALRRTPGPELLRQRNLFYVKMGWYPELESKDKYHTLNIRELLTTPRNPKNQSWEQFISITQMFREAIRAVSFHPFAFRVKVNRPDDVHVKPMSSLQNETSVSKYARTLVSLVYFIRNVQDHAVARSAVSLSNTILKSLLNLFKKVQSKQSQKEATFCLMHLLLCESSAMRQMSEKQALIALFLRFSCRTSDDSLISADVS